MFVEEWSLGSATATVEVHADRLRVTLHGLITAAAYEALHIRLGQMPAKRRVLEIGEDALIVASAKSLAQAAARGTPLRQIGPGHVILITAQAWRAGWVFEHCALMTAEGLYRAAALQGLSG